MPNPSSSEASSIELSLSIQYPGFALDLNLVLPARGVTAWFGRSGSGKTTCLRLIAGLERGRGRLFALGECWQDDARKLFVPPHRRGLGYVFQEASLFPHMNVRENLAYAERRRRSDAAAARFDHLVELCGIGGLLSRDSESLSGGERQRVAIARALLAAPRMLLLDEPLAALDESRKGELLPYLERLRDELAIPILYVSHSVEEVARLADTIVLLENGRVLAQGSLFELFPRLDLPFAEGEQAGVVFEGRLAEHAEAHALSRIACGEVSLWVSRVARELGAPVRARILARDVSIALSLPGPSSILNVIRAEIMELSDYGPDRVNVRLLAGNVTLLARITRRSREALSLREGLVVHAQVKSVAVVT